MGLYHSPKIATSSLIFAVDAGNSKSYPGSGTAWTDLVSQSNSTLTNGPTYDSANGGSIVFDGVDDYSTGPISASDVAGLTICAFVNPTSLTGGNKAIVTKNANLVQLDTTQIVWWPDVSIGSISVPITITTGQWQCYAITQVGTNCVMYKNGVSFYTSAVTSTYRTSGFSQTTIGAYGASRYFNGKISNVLIYNRVLTAAEILQNFNAYRGRYGI